MKKQPIFTLLGAAFLLLSQVVFSQVQTKAPTTLNVLPPASIDALRVGNGLISNIVSGTVGGFGATDQWIGIGSPLSTPVLYGERTQWNQQAFIKALRSQNPAVPTAIKDAIIEWGNQGGEMQFRYITNPALPTGFIKIHTLTSAGNAYYGATAPPILFGTPKVGINTTNQAGLNSTSVNTTSVVNGAFRTTANGANTYGVSNYSYSSSGSTNNTNYGVIAYAGGTGAGTRNYGVYASTFGLSTGINYAVYGSATVGANSWAGYFQGNVFSTGLYIGSDAQLKTNVSTETNVLPNIMRVRPVTYSFNVEQNKELNLSPEKQHGFIAQELAEVFPEVVKGSRFSIPDADGFEASSKTYLSVNYLALISILYKGIQEQQAQIEELRRAIAITATPVSTVPETGRQGGGEPATIVTRDGRFELSKFSLAQNTPNPFSSSTTIRYTLPDGVRNAVIAVFDLNGKMLLQFNGLTGRSQVEINGNSLQSGMYIYSLLADGQEVISKRMILTR
ncbi:MAG: tail fiber domain-containing protein [Chitinophagaceae bacterium]|nr:tail fiber domain-containing protein [Chitinophagaceae bacterium]